jgi:hypothetical protein
MELSGRMIRFLNSNFSGADGVPAMLARGFSSKFEIGRDVARVVSLIRYRDYCLGRHNQVQYARDVGSGTNMIERGGQPADSTITRRRDACRNQAA